MNSSDQLSDIASLLMLRGSFMRSLGLLNGKMGAVIFFYYYSKYSGCSRYGKFAEELLEEVYKQIYNGYPLAFADGLSGIAWAVVYLLRNGFVKADDEQELLADLDLWLVCQCLVVAQFVGLRGECLGLHQNSLTRCKRKC